MRLRTLFIIIVPVVIVAWWLLAEDPEQEVRFAHAELVRLVNKSADDATVPFALELLTFQGLFADLCEVSGDAGRFVATYAPDEAASTAYSVRASFDHVELTFGELAIEFPADDEALVRFTATVAGERNAAGATSIAESRNVVSRMNRIDGDWLFTEFQLTDSSSLR